MKSQFTEIVSYSLYLSLGDETPDGVAEISEGVNLDATSDGKPAGIVILKVSKKIDMRTILSCTLELEEGILKQKVS